MPLVIQVGKETDVKIPAEIKGSPVTGIGFGAFAGCTDVLSVNLNDSVTSLGDRAFGGCTGLVAVVIPNSVLSIGNRAFSGCISLASIVIPDTVNTIGFAAFQDTAWYDAQPDGVVYAGKIAYEYKGDRSSATNIEIIVGTEIIEEGLFSNCINLTTVLLPESITKIERNAFSNCISLTSITIPYSVTSVATDSFATIRDPITGIMSSERKSSWHSSFGGCNNLVSLIYKGRAYSAIIVGYLSNGDAQYDMPKAFYDDVNT